MGENRLSPQQIGKKYRAAVQTYARQLADPALRLSFIQEADAYFRRCARTLWKQDGEITEAHVDTYNEICSGSNPSPQTLYFELASAVSYAPELTAPGFFSDLVHSGGKRSTEQFFELCRVVFRLFSAVGSRAGAKLSAGEQFLAELGRGTGMTFSPSDLAPPVQVPVEAAAEQVAPPTEAEDAPQPENAEDLLAELDALCGLEQVKKDVRSLINLVKVRRLREENGLTMPPMSLHLVFMGNPGTGKTTVARLLARLYHAVGVLSKGQLVETDRSGLVAGYVGQTAIKTQEVITSALGGVLFIDEAYSLISQEGSNDFGRECIEILLKNMEDHRDDLIVIVAGYTNLMEKFIHSNPGLESRFNKYFYFEDYRPEQLLSILESQCSRGSYILSEEAREKAKALLELAYETRDENFGNARDVRNLFESLIARQSDRVAQLEAPGVEDLMLITAEDFEDEGDPEQTQSGGSSREVAENQ